MKNIYVIPLVFFFTDASFAQSGQKLQYFREPGFRGLHVFETGKDTAQPRFEEVAVRVGGDFAIQFQSLQHSTRSGDTLVALGNNFNLPTANLNIGVQLADGLRMSLVTYLSSRHHNEAWVKGGHIQIDKLDFIRKDLLKKLMEILTLKGGLDEINYGDTHFRRSDNARAIYNPFAGNYIMDAFTTEVFGELYVQKKGILAMAAVSNGNLNQSPVKGSKDLFPSYYAKLGYDSQLHRDLRVRLTASCYISPGYDNGQYLYSGDRAGSRYYNVMQPVTATGDNFRSGRFAPGFWKFTALQVTPFVKFKGAELFGVYELVQGDKSRTETGGTYTQLGGELLYRFGKKEQFYAGARYNTVAGYDTSGAASKSIARLNLAGGWFLTKNVLLKLEYVSQDYAGEGWKGSVYEGGNFRGFMTEAAISF
jgi:hypothetical protein